MWSTCRHHEDFGLLLSYTHKNSHLLGPVTLSAYVKYLYLTRRCEENTKEVEIMIISLEIVSILNSVESKLQIKNEFKRIIRKMFYIYLGLDKVPGLNF